MLGNLCQFVIFYVLKIFVRVLDILQFICIFYIDLTISESLFPGTVGLEYVNDSGSVVGVLYRDTDVSEKVFEVPLAGWFPIGRVYRAIYDTSESYVVEPAPPVAQEETEEPSTDERKKQENPRRKF